MTHEERQGRLDELERSVRAFLAATADPDERRRALQQLDEITALRRKAAALAMRTDAADPITRARMREADDDDEARKEDGLHPLRDGRDRCSAHRRDGEECLAPAVPFTLVCRRHGGSSPQVKIAARHLELQAALYDAAMGHQEAKGTASEFDALCAWSHAEKELKEFEAKLDQLAELRAQLRRSKAAQASPDAED
jgi:hypothetical protein